MLQCAETLPRLHAQWNAWSGFVSDITQKPVTQVSTMLITNLFVVQS